MARSQYALPQEGKPDRSDPRGLAAYIRETAQKYGIDPEVALRVAKSEGLSTFQSSVRRTGKGSHGGREDSWGAFQLYMGGGLGNAYQKATGKDPRDPANEKDTIDFALKHAAGHGWGSWYGAKNTGIGEYEGIGAGAKTASADTDTAGGGAAPPDTQVKGTRTSTEAPEVTANAPAAASAGGASDFLTKLQDPKGNVSAGLGEAMSGLGQAITGAPKGGDMYATPSRAPVPIAPTPAPPQLVPTVDPRAAENQRQQLAMALQRLNSGRLY